MVPWKHIPLLSDIAGYGVYSDCGIFISAPVPTAELTAAIESLQVAGATQVAICTDSSYIRLGATGAPRCWKVRGWIGSIGAQVSNVALWEELLVGFEKPGRAIEWAKHHHILELRATHKQTCSQMQ